jgi:hypothetical protein
MWRDDGANLNMGMCRISNRAFAGMLSDLERYPDDETGGFLIGTENKDTFWIVEVVDAGLNAVHEVGKLTCDMDSIKHMIMSIVGLYESDMQVIGVWHKHNNKCNPPFSTEDMELHERLFCEYGRDILSILFQKDSLEGGYILRVFRYGENQNLTEEDFEVMDITQYFPYRSWGLLRNC